MDIVTHFLFGRVLVHVGLFCCFRLYFGVLLAYCLVFVWLIVVWFIVLGFMVVALYWFVLRITYLMGCGDCFGGCLWWIGCGVLICV